MSFDAAVTETEYALNGANLGPFSTEWPYEQDSDVQVYIDDGGGMTLLGAGQYVLTDAVQGSLTAGGSVMLSNALLTGAAWPAGSQLYLVRNVAGGQPSSFGEMGIFSPSSSEAALDHIARQVQELKTLALRLLAGRPGEALNPLPSAATRANGLMGFDANGQPIVVPGLIIGAVTARVVASQTLSIPNCIYTVDCTASAVTLTLEDIDLFEEGWFVEIFDGMNYAGQNPITIQASGTDMINDHGVSSSQFIINISNTISRITKLNGVWRPVQYGA